MVHDDGNYIIPSSDHTFVFTSLEKVSGEIPTLGSKWRFSSPYVGPGAALGQYAGNSFLIFSWVRHYTHYEAEH